MRLLPGTRLGPYEIERPLGAGGMGEVYRAVDRRLGRAVAVKTPSDSLIGDADAVARFDRENRTIAALSHPNILAVYDVGLLDQIPSAVLELLEGETLRAALDRGLLSRANTLGYAQQIARGLAAAHAKGIIHRDLKPDNIFGTTDELFEIQEQVARAIVSGLRVTLTPDESRKIADHGIKEPRAYELYLRARTELERYADPFLSTPRHDHRFEPLMVQVKAVWERL